MFTQPDALGFLAQVGAARLAAVVLPTKHDQNDRAATMVDRLHGQHPVIVIQLAGRLDPTSIAEPKVEATNETGQRDEDGSNRYVI